jgi:hypothetical protein
MANVFFVQEAGAASQTFRFEDDRLVAAEADARQAREVHLAYLDLDLEAPPAPPPRRGLFGLFKNPARRIHARFALFKPRRGWDAVTVWADAQAQDIVDELSARWRRARRQAATVDFSAPPREELQRFQTLLERGVVSAEECAAAAVRILARAAGTAR